MKFIKMLRVSHKFFVKQTPSYIAGHREPKYIKTSGFSWVKYDYYYLLNFREKLYYPIAYCKFMFYCIKDYCNGR